MYALPDASLVRVQNSEGYPCSFSRVYCIFRVFRYTFICVSLSDSSSFCLFSHTVSVVEHCALQMPKGSG